MDFDREPEASSFLVEVSGWDASDRFFVEHTVLQWGRDESKEIGLRSAVREGDVVFVRLLQPTEGAENFPVACQVVKAIGKDAENRTLVQVVQLRPRAPIRETVRERSGSAVLLA